MSHLKTLICVSFLLFANYSFAQSWINLEHGDRPIPIKFVTAPGEGKKPTVLLVHGTGGPDGRGEMWARFFSERGINTLLVDFKKGRFTGPSDRHVPFYPSLIEKTHQWLKVQPGVDATKITYMGLSLGAFLGFRLDSTTEFSKYILFYPGCYNLDRIGNSYLVEKERVNPTLLVWGTNDAYEEGTYCPKIIQKMKGSFDWLALDRAGHGFDGTRSVTFADHASPSGRASLEPNAEATEIAKRKIMEFILSK